MSKLRLIKKSNFIIYKSGRINLVQRLNFRNKKFYKIIL